MRYLSSKEVAESTGLSLRQLQTWSEIGLVNAVVRGHARQWSPDEALKAEIYSRLRTAGMMPSRILDMKPAIDAVIAGDRRYLVICGDRVIGLNEVGTLEWLSVVVEVR